MRAASILVLFLAACSSRENIVVGTVYDGPLGEHVLPDVSVTLRDEAGETYWSGVTDANGSFSGLAPRAQTIFAVIGGEGRVPASFTGVSGLLQLTVPDFLERALDDDTTEQVLVNGAPIPSLYGVTTALADEWRARYAGCPGADAQGGAILASVRYFLFDSEATGGDFVPPDVQHPVAEAVSDATGERFSACYLDADGIAWDGSAVDAGAAQQFAIFGLPEGRFTLAVRHNITDSVFTDAYFSVYVPLDGVAARYPLWIEFPLF